MSYLDAIKENQGGFNFDLCLRNKELASKQVVSSPHFTKTGTTIAGLVYKDGIVLGADTRATAGTIVAEKCCDKIHYIAPNMYCCGAGTAADTQWVTDRLSSELELMRLNTNRQSRVAGAIARLREHLYQYQGHVGAHLILGGFDCQGPQLVSVAAHGSFSYLPYTTMGSGSLAAIATLESGYRDDLTEQEAIDLVTASIESGIVHDLGSGSNVDICVIKRDPKVDVKVDFLRLHKTDNNQKLNKPFPYKAIPNNHPFHRQFNVPIEKIPVNVDASKNQMEVEN
ncbi:hypothetical protein ABPG72_007287 [Tetrahymena utriculariae]